LEPEKEADIPVGTAEELRQLTLGFVEAQSLKDMRLEQCGDWAEVEDPYDSRARHSNLRPASAPARRAAAARRSKSAAFNSTDRATTLAFGGAAARSNRHGSTNPASAISS
jgi:hypothetical protein